ncbi:MAG: hemolysin III family protein [Actinomycetota bacterium]
MEAHERIRLGRMTHPVRGFLDGSAAMVSLIGAVLLLTLSQGGTWRRLSLFIFGLSLVAMFTTSTLYHSIPWGTVWKKRMQRLDHAMIHVLVAGTFTPIAAIVLDGWVRWATLSVQWGIVASGALHKVLTKEPRHWISVALSTTQGWLALFLLWPLADRLPWTALMMIGLGGVLYTVGMVFLVTGRPRLWPRVFSYHEAFHVLVIAAAAIHFSAISAWVATYRG